MDAICPVLRKLYKCPLIYLDVKMRIPPILLGKHVFDNSVDCFGRYFVNLSKHVQILNNGTHRSIVIDSCVLADDSMFVCSCNDEKTACEVFVREPPVTIVSGFEDVQVTDGEEAVFKVNTGDPIFSTSRK